MKPRKGREVKQISRIMGIERKWENVVQLVLSTYIYIHIHVIGIAEWSATYRGDRISLSLIHVDPWI